MYPDPNHPPTAPPPRPVRPVHPAAAALLNLTGVALGYAYLQRPLRAALHLAGTAGLVAAAFATDAAALPWLWQGIAAIWLGWMAVDAARLARRDTVWLTAAVGPRPVPRLPVLVGAVAVAAVVAGHVGYGAAGRAVYADGLAAQSGGDCAAATARYDAVTGPFELTLAREVGEAATRREECVVFVTAGIARTESRFDEAARGYRELRRLRPDTVLVPMVAQNLAGTLSEWAQALRRSGRPADAVAVYAQLLAEISAGPGLQAAREELAATHLEVAAQARDRMPPAAGAARVGLARTAVDALLVVVADLDDTPSAQAVPQALRDTYAAANGLFADGRFCEALPVLDWFVALPAAGSSEVAGLANTDRPVAQLECGLARYREGDFAGAIDVLQVTAGEYPDHQGTPQARSTVIAAKVAEALLSRDAAAAVPPIPEPLGDLSPGSISVTIHNSAPREALIRIAGVTAHEFVIPPCADCTAVDEGCGSLAGKPSVTVRLRPGSYAEMVSSTDSATPRFFVEGANVYEPGFGYTACYYIGSSLR